MSTKNIPVMTKEIKILLNSRDLSYSEMLIALDKVSSEIRDLSRQEIAEAEKLFVRKLGENYLRAEEYAA